MDKDSVHASLKCYIWNSEPPKQKNNDLVKPKQSENVTDERGDELAVRVNVA